MKIILNVCLALWLQLLIVSAAMADHKDVKLQLKWKHQFQFAGYYAALEKGYYADAGFNVELIEATEGEDPVNRVLSGNADFGVGTSELMVRHAGGAPVVVLGVVYQHSPLGFLTLEGSGIRTVHDLVGKRVMMEPGAADLMLYLQREGIALETSDIHKHQYDTQALIDKQVDAMSVYTTDEPYTLERLGYSYRLFEPASAGIDFYGDNLFTTQALVEHDPQLVAKFREASFKGWKYAMQHPDEIVHLIYSKYSQRHSINHLRFEAQEMRRLLLPDLVEEGYMHIGRWQHIADTYKAVGMLPKAYEFRDFLYRLPEDQKLERLQNWLLVSFAATLLIFTAAIYLVSLYRRISLSESNLATLMERAPLALMTLDHNGTVVSWNHEAEKTFGWIASEAVGLPVVDLIVPESVREHVKALIQKDNVTTSNSQSENWNVRKDGEMILCEWRNTYVQRVEGQYHIICMAKDITEHKELEAQLREMAHFDPLTQLPNRTLFYERFDEALSQAKADQSLMGVIFLDLDGFKVVNDTFGHEVGDRVLQVVAKRLATSVRDSDTVARMGGDEFVILLPGVRDESDVGRVIDKIQSKLADPVQLDSEIFSFKASIGVSVYPRDGQMKNDLLRYADRDMYKQKYAYRKAADVG